jgi:hypothetical protein
MKYLIILPVFLISACSGNPEPVVDLSQSKDAQNFQIDWQQCDWLVQKYDLEAKTALLKCLDGRGHVALGVKGK